MTSGEGTARPSLRLKTQKAPPEPVRPPEPVVVPQEVSWTLDGIDILADLTSEERRAIANGCAWLKVPEGGHIFELGDHSCTFCFLVTGRVRAVDHRAGAQDVAFIDVPAGGSFGELSAVDGLPRSASMLALEESIVAVLSRERFQALIHEQPPVCLRLLNGFARNIRNTNARLVDLSTRTPVQRVYSELLRASEPDPMKDGSWIIDPMPRHEEIASWAGTTSDTVARAVGQLLKLGVAKRRSKSLHILDRQQIQRLAMAT
jgi:CRP/FNR family transcriptional regulator, cyclic AMP receptor protein